MVELDNFPVNTFLQTAKVCLNSNCAVGLVSATVLQSDIIHQLSRDALHLIIQVINKNKKQCWPQRDSPFEYYWKLATAWPLYYCPPIKAVFHQFGNKTLWDSVLKAMLNLK